MDSSGKVNLEDTNKTKRSFRASTLLHVFKKQKYQNRDEKGQFTAGSGGLKMIHKLDWKRTAPLIATTAIAGGLLVFHSFAGTSHTATITNWYQICHGRTPDSGGLTYWVGRLDTGEDANAVFAAFVASGGCTPRTATPQSGKDTTPTPANTTTTPQSQSSVNEAWVKSTYQTLLGRAPNANEISYWISRGQTYPATVVYEQIAATPEAFKKSVATKITDAKARYDWTLALVENGRKDRNSTAEIAKKNPVERRDLTLIAQAEGRVRQSVGQASPFIGQLQGWYNTAASIASNDGGFATYRDQLLVYYRGTENGVKDLNNLVIQISEHYKTAERTYEANLNFFQQIRDRQREAADEQARSGRNESTSSSENPSPTTSGSPAARPVQQPKYLLPINYRCNTFTPAGTPQIHGTYVSCVYKNMGFMKNDTYNIAPKYAQCENSFLYKLSPPHKSPNGWTGVNCVRRF